MVRQREGAMNGAQAAALGMLAPAAGVAAMQGLLLDLAAARSPRSAAGAFNHDMSEAQVCVVKTCREGCTAVAEINMSTDQQMDLPACL
jgi:hypothetical protein